MRAWAEAVRPSWTTTATGERVPSPGRHDPVLVRPDRPLFAPCPPLRFQRGGDTSACHPDAPLVERCMHRPSKAEHRVHMLRRGQHWRLSGGEAAGGLVARTGPCRRARSGRGRCRRVGAAPGDHAHKLIAYRVHNSTSPPPGRPGIGSRRRTSPDDRLGRRGRRCSRTGSALAAELAHRQPVLPPARQTRRSSSAAMARQPMSVPPGLARPA